MSVRKFSKAFPTGSNEARLALFLANAVNLCLQLLNEYAELIMEPLVLVEKNNGPAFATGETAG